MSHAETILRAGLALATVAAAAAPAGAQLAPEPLEECTVQVLNVSVKVAPDGTWELPNVPANGGQVRVRLNCVQGDRLRTGQSQFFSIQPNKVNAIPRIPFGDPDPGPTAIVAHTSKELLTAAGETTSLQVVGVYADGAEKDLTPAAKGTSYQSTNDGVISVSDDGQLVAHQSGTVVIGVWNEGITAALWVQAKIGEDSDGDGLPDDYENQNGLDANDPLDALVDHDKDNLINLAEFQYGTDPFEGDTDGDGIPDGEEVKEGDDGWETNPVLADGDGDLLNDLVEILTGTDPNDPMDFDFDAALLGLEVNPGNIVLVFNPVIGEASVQLQVVGLVIDGTGVDLTDSPWLSYASLDYSVVSFGATPGQVFAGNEGATSVLVSIASHSLSVPALVKSFTPQGLAALPLPCFGNDVALGGKRALVACGADGVHVVSVADPADPWITGTLDTSGNANGVVTNGVTTWIADGGNGLVVAAVDATGAPVMTGQLSLPGDAWELDLEGHRALVAAGDAGLHVVEVGNVYSPVLLGTLPLSGFARDVSVEGDRAAVSLSGGEVALVDVTDPQAPLLLGTVAADASSAFGLHLGEERLFVATGNGGLSVIDVTTPTAPAVTATLGTPEFMLTDLVVRGSLLFGADYYRVNSVPIVQVTLPDEPLFAGVVELSQFNDANGVAVDADGQLVAMTGVLGQITAEKQASGSSYLFIGQYDDLNDPFGIPPTCVITSPEDADVVTSGAKLGVSVAALDDVFVEGVRVYLDGQLAATDPLAPYEVKVKLPQDLEVHTLTAEAVDPGGNVGTCDPVHIALVPDPLTTVVGVVTDAEGTPLMDVQVYVLGEALGVLTGPDGSFELPGAPTWDDLTLGVVGAVDSDLMMDLYGPFPPVYGGITDVGTLVLETPIGAIFGGPIVSAMVTFQASPGITAAGGLVVGPITSPLVTFHGHEGALGDGVLTSGPIVSDIVTFGGVAGALGGGTLTTGPIISALVTFGTVVGGASDGALTMGPITSDLVTFSTVAGALGGGTLTMGPVVSAIVTFGGDNAAIGDGTQILGPIVSALLSFTDRAIVASVEPPTASIAAGSATLSITGQGLEGATDVVFHDGAGPDPLITATDVTAEPDGSLTVTVTIDPTAAPGPRAVVVVTGAGSSLADATDANTLELVP